MQKGSAALLLVLVAVAGCSAPAAEDPMALPPASPAPATPASLTFVETPEARAEAPLPPQAQCPAGWSAEDVGCRTMLGEEGAHNLEPSLAVDPHDERRWLVAWTVRERAVAADVSLGLRGRVQAAWTEDAGATWSTAGLADPTFLEGPGVERYSFDERALIGPDGVARVAYIGDLPRVLATGAGVGRITVASTPGGGEPWTYTRAVDMPGARFDYLAFAAAPDTGDLYLATDEQTTSGVWLFRSTDGGATWTGPVVVHASRAPDGYHGLPSIVALPGGIVIVTTYVSARTDDPLATGAAARVSRDGGETFDDVQFLADGFDALRPFPSAGVELADGTTRAVALVANGEGLAGLETRDGGGSWSPPALLLDATPRWASLALAPEGGWAGLVRIDGDEATTHALLRVLPGRGPSSARLAQGSVPFEGDPGDDYGGRAILPDGSVVAAYALSEGSAERIAVHVIR